MINLASLDWVAERIGQSDFIPIDARRPMKYLAGHLPGAVNIPAYKMFDTAGRLLDAASLAQFIGNAGLGDEGQALIYDSPEGQNAAMLAWILEYLGRTEVYVLESFFEAWKASGREVFYKPVVLAGRTLTSRVNPSARATLDDVRNARNVKLVDFRSREEYSGVSTLGEDKPGHIPGAVNIVWRDLGISPERVLKPVDELARINDGAGISQNGQVIAYCRSGPRAALGYLALSRLGVNVRLFDGSFMQWSQAGLPIEK
ncbi:MAG TPA: rhodanese-like domain-containing protein [Candidatus Binataceae bacterium]|nr:rhodanese-like domain-containing protein [Candidatus Binataceae bacterium]